MKNDFEFQSQFGVVLMFISVALLAVVLNGRPITVFKAVVLFGIAWLTFIKIKKWG